MILTLEATGPEAATLGAGRRREFSAPGGIIGRAKGTDWTLPNSKVSGRHAVITYADGVFYLEDTSTNGVFINSPKNRLVSGRRYALQAGDRILIDPYEIEVAISSDRAPVGHDRLGAAADPFADIISFDPAPPRRQPGLQPLPGEPVASEFSQELDPLKLIGGGSRPATPIHKGPTVEELDQSLLRDHFQPPKVAAPPPAEPDGFNIPAGYDPLRDAFKDPSGPLRGLGPPPDRDLDLTPPPDLEPPPVPPEPPARRLTPPPRPAPTPIPAPAAPPVPPREPTAEPAANLSELLAGAGLDNVAASPDLARTFGRIFRVVVSGVMDVLRSRQQIKDEFRMRITQFQPADNNPLKFSANVDDALHNLLVKRNLGYLEPAEAFKDAFDDLRNHQLAMLEGMRVAFDSMLAEFHPDRLEMQFDGPVKRRALFPALARARYWQLYRARRAEIDKDPDARFRKLFGEEFARAYEEQLNRLEAESRSGSAEEEPPGPSNR